MNEIEGLKMHIDCAIDRLNELHKEVLGYHIAANFPKTRAEYYNF